MEKDSKVKLAEEIFGPISDFHGMGNLDHASGGTHEVMSKIIAAPKFHDAEQMDPSAFAQEDIHVTKEMLCEHF